jgi:nucleoside-diphosphate-sugar epimerase
MKILITGSNGYIGNHLTSRLLKKKEVKVVGINRSKSTCTNKNFTNIKFDICNDKWTSLIHNNIDVVIYLAQSDQYRNFPEGANSMISVNAQGVLQTAQWAMNNNVKKFIYASTGNVYKSKKTLIHENYICEPASFYGVSKLCGENII